MAKEKPASNAAPMGAIKTKLFDADDTNPTFARFCPDAEQLILTGKGLEPLFNWLEAPENIGIVDFGARASRSLEEFDDNTGFFQMAERFNARVVIAYALTPANDSIGLLKGMSENIGDNVSWVIARSAFAVGLWTTWEGSQTRKHLETLKAAELVMPALDADAWSSMDRLSMAAAEASENKELPLVVRSYLFKWRQKYFAAFNESVRPMINDGGKTLFLVTGDKGGVGKSALARALTDWLTSSTTA